MKKVLKKFELTIAMILIIIYVALNMLCINNYGVFDYRTFLYNFLYLTLILIFIVESDQIEYYGLTDVKNSKKCLYFIPLIFIISVNLWTGFNIQNTYIEIVFYLLNMLMIGFLEEIIFRGFLYKGLKKNGMLFATIVTSLTFGFGHILNLFNGTAVVATLIQIITAISIGFLFVTIFDKCKSIWPCIIAHALFNFFSIFQIENNISMYVSPIVLFVIPMIYAFYLRKKIK